MIQDIFFNGIKKIDNLIKEMQLKRSSNNDIVFEWIPYNQLNNIEEISKGDFATIYSATWKDGPLNSSLNYDHTYKKKYIRKPDEKVSLRCMHNSQNITNEFLNEV